MTKKITGVRRLASERAASARRMADIAPFHVMALLARARELEAAGRSIIHMEVGDSEVRWRRAKRRAWWL
jgi:hypothetical protein